MDTAVFATLKKLIGKHFGKLKRNIKPEIKLYHQHIDWISQCHRRKCHSGNGYGQTKCTAFLLDSGKSRIP